MPGPSSLKYLHRDCCMCLAKNSDQSSEEALMSLMLMFKIGFDLETAYRDLCFQHRRLLDLAIREAKKELGMS